ncbi:hypothetical protein Hanom_Chr04g00315551 [Helianthus anomalus]
MKQIKLHDKSEIVIGEQLTNRSRQECSTFLLAQAYLSTQSYVDLVNQLRFDLSTKINSKHQVSNSFHPFHVKASLHHQSACS